MSTMSEITTDVAGAAPTASVVISDIVDIAR